MANRIKKNSKRDKFDADCAHYQTIRKHGENTHVQARIRKVKKIRHLRLKELFAEVLNES